MSSKSESDMDLIILVEPKKILINFVIGNFTILTQLCDLFVVFFNVFRNERFNDVTLDRA